MAIDQVLEKWRTEAGIEAVLVVDGQGNIVGSARSDEAVPETLGEMLDMAKRILARPGDVAMLVDRGESTFFDWEGRQIVCRWFQAGSLYLLVVLTPQEKGYKRLISQLVRVLQDNLKG